MKYDLSIMIPSRNEMFLNQTISSIQENIRGKTEIIVVCDGSWPLHPIEDKPNITIIHHSESIGQRAATNEAAKISRAEFVMKCDAHCSFDEGFDVKMIIDCEKDWTVVPRMYNLHAFNWKCLKCGNETYQGPTPSNCQKCDNTTEFERVIIWKEKTNPTSDFFRFDSSLHFQYWREFKNRPEAKNDLAPTMSLLGACWMMPRERYWELGGMDEEHGSWGQMGTEIACKSWLSGGALMVNKKTWFAHMFRTQGGDFGFPYPLSGKDIQRARNRSKKLWVDGTWEKQKYPLSWLIDKFAPVPGWESIDKKEQEVSTFYGSNEDNVENKNISNMLSKGIVYYTDNKLDANIMEIVQQNLLNQNLLIVSVSLAPIDFGENIVLNLERSYLTMFKQILAGLGAIDADIVYFAEHDVIYHPSHFEFTPAKKDVYYYNQNTWKVRHTDGLSLFFYCKQTSQLCAYRELLIEHYKKRIERVEKEGFSRKMGFEPGSHGRPERVDDYKSEGYFSQYPNVDIRHAENLTSSRFKPEQYRSQRSIKGWTLADEIPFWGKTKGRFNEFLNEIGEKI